MKFITLSHICTQLVLFWASAAVMASGVPTPTELPGGRIVTLQESRDLVEGGAWVIDVRSAINYGRGHIPGAVLAPYKGKSTKQVDFDPSLDQFPLSALPEDKNADLLIYSHGDTGWKSYKAAVTAIRSDYTQVNWFRDGLKTWMAADMSVER